MKIKKSIAIVVVLLFCVFSLNGCKKEEPIQEMTWDILTQQNTEESTESEMQTNVGKTEANDYVASPKDPLPLRGKVIGVDAGHQAKGDSTQEAEAPGSTKTKNKVTSGTQGKWSKVPEHEVNLKVALYLKDMLEKQGATVIMTRETANVNISNIERAKVFNKHKTDFAVRIHCNGSDDTAAHGVFMMIPTQNPFLNECKLGAEIILKTFVKETGAKDLGVQKYSNQTGFNWSERAVVTIEMGHMTNKEEDYKLVSDEYQKKMAKGISKGIEDYFTNK